MAEVKVHPWYDSQTFDNDIGTCKGTVSQDKAVCGGGQGSSLVRQSQLRQRYGYVKGQYHKRRLSVAEVKVHPWYDSHTFDNDIGT